MCDSLLQPAHTTRFAPSVPRTTCFQCHDPAEPQAQLLGRGRVAGASSLLIPVVAMFVVSLSDRLPAGHIGKIRRGYYPRKVSSVDF